MTLREKWEDIRSKGMKDFLLGDYDYNFLCMPRLLPYSKKHRSTVPPFFARRDRVALLVMLVMGLQHAMAMMGGIITPPLLVYNESPKNTNKAQYLISASLIVCGLTTLVQISRIRIWGTKFQIGSGLLSVMGVSFTFLSISQSVIATFVAEGKSWNEGYGACLGTYCVCALFEFGLAWLPPKVLRKLFPPVICGVTVFLIGMGLCGSGMKNWGGGSFCASYYLGYLPATKVADTCYTFNSTSGAYTKLAIPCYQKPFIPTCSSNGNVFLVFGSGQYVGMGLTVVVFMIGLEIFGSPFLKNCAVLLSLFFGCFISGVVKSKGQSYWDRGIINRAPGITFLWVHRFPLKVYGPAVLPALICYIILAVEAIGDITATEEGGREPTEGPAHDRHVKGGILSDSLNAMFSCLATTTPCTTYAQNNGIIVLTRCASRQVGYAVVFWLLLSGIIAKFGAFFVAIPNCVLGGMTTFLFANVCVSGIKVMVSAGLPRRERFIAMVSLAFGIGVDLAPQWATNNLWPVHSYTSKTVKGLRDGIILILSTGFCFGAVVAMILNSILPSEAVEAVEVSNSKHGKVGLPDAEKGAAVAIMASGH